MFVPEITSTEFAMEQLVSGKTIAREVIKGLSQRPMQIAPKYFYDQNGSELLDAITRLDEYYIARVERAILADNCAAISAEIGSGRALLQRSNFSKPCAHRCTAKVDC